jgi:hypothetical protein
MILKNYLLKLLFMQHVHKALVFCTYKSEVYRHEIKSLRKIIYKISIR